MTTLTNTKLSTYFQPHPAVVSSEKGSLQKKAHEVSMAKKYATSFIDVFDKELYAFNGYESDPVGGKDDLRIRAMCHSAEKYLREKYTRCKRLPSDLQLCIEQDADLDDLMNKHLRQISPHLIPHEKTNLKKFVDFLLQELRGKKLRLQMPAIGKDNELLIIQYIFNDTVQYLKNNYINVFNK